MAGESGVTYEFKDLFEKLERALSKGFERVDQQFNEVRRMLDGKADIARVAALEAKHAEYEVRMEDRLVKFAEAVDVRFRSLETTRTEGVTLGRLGMWLIGTVGVGVLLASVTVVAAVLSGGKP